MWISPKSGRRTSPLFLLLALSFGVSGCANPGPPKPPSLNLPIPIKDLHADRIGSEVRLAWTTPANSTDDLPLKQPLTAEICRQLDPSGSPSTPCVVVQHLPIRPGATTASDPLPPDLLADPVHLLHYRVRLLNPSGRSADASNPAFAATGQAPSPVAGLHAAPSPAGTRLLWHSAESPLAAAVLLDRTTTAAPPLANRPPAGKSPTISSRKPAPTPVTIRLQGSPTGADPGGTLDLSAQRDATYSYTAWRSRSVQIAGQTLTLRSADSTPFLLTVHDTSPPATPTGLQAIVDAPAVDLSWEPNTDPDLAGYYVERATLPDPAALSDPAASAATPAAEPAPWQRLNPAPVVGPSFRDLPPSPGTFRYRILAVDTTGNLSSPSPAVAIRIQSSSAP